MMNGTGDGTREDENLGHSMTRRVLALSSFGMTVTTFIVCFIWNAMQDPDRATATPTGITAIAVGGFFASLPLLFTHRSRVYVPPLRRTFVLDEQPFGFWCAVGILPLTGLAVMIYGSTLIGQELPRP